MDNGETEHAGSRPSSSRKRARSVSDGPLVPKTRRKKRWSQEGRPSPSHGDNGGTILPNPDPAPNTDHLVPTINSGEGTPSGAIEQDHQHGSISLRAKTGDQGDAELISPPATSEEQHASPAVSNPSDSPKVPKSLIVKLKVKVPKAPGSVEQSHQATVDDVDAAEDVRQPAQLKQEPDMTKSPVDTTSHPQHPQHHPVPPDASESHPTVAHVNHQHQVPPGPAPLVNGTVPNDPSQLRGVFRTSSQDAMYTHMTSAPSETSQLPRAPMVPTQTAPVPTQTAPSANSVPRNNATGPVSFSPGWRPVNEPAPGPPHPTAVQQNRYHQPSNGDHPQRQYTPRMAAQQPRDARGTPDYHASFTRFAAPHQHPMAHPNMVPPPHAGHPVRADPGYPPQPRQASYQERHPQMAGREANGAAFVGHPQAVPMQSAPNGEAAHMSRGSFSINPIGTPVEEKPRMGTALNNTVVIATWPPDTISDTIFYLRSYATKDAFFNHLQKSLPTNMKHRYVDRVDMTLANSGQAPSRRRFAINIMREDNDDGFEFLKRHLRRLDSAAEPELEALIELGG